MLSCVTINYVKMNLFMHIRNSVGNLCHFCLAQVNLTQTYLHTNPKCLGIMCNKQWNLLEVDYGSTVFEKINTI